MDWWVWLIIAIVIVVAIAAAAMAAKQGMETRRRHQAESLREDVRERGVDVQHKEAAAMEARASAEETQMKAANLEDEAAHGREGMQENLQKADRIDPDSDNARDADAAEDVPREHPPRA